jgi:cutinase
MRFIKILVTLLCFWPTALGQGSVGGLAGLPKGMSGCPAGAPKSTSPAGAAAPKQECSPVHFVIGRGSCEPPGPGTLRSLADSVGKEIPGITLEGIDYPAELNFSNLLGYVSSSSAGATAGKNQITRYAKNCPKSKIVVTGVSQVRDEAEYMTRISG